MTELNIRLNDKFTTTTLEDWEYELFKNEKIESIGLEINPMNLKTQMELGFAIPFTYKSIVKKVTSFQGSLCEETKTYTLEINGEMKVKIRSGVQDRLNEEDGGYVFKVGHISVGNGAGVRGNRVALDGVKYHSGETILTDCPTVTEFSFS